jgi:hypothetical protein
VPQPPPSPPPPPQAAALLVTFFMSWKITHMSPNHEASHNIVTFPFQERRIKVEFLPFM